MKAVHLSSVFSHFSGKTANFSSLARDCKINIPPWNGGDFSFGHSPNTTGCAQVRFLLACQPCNYYVNPLKRD